MLLDHKVILKLGLEKAKELGLDEIIITCNVDNIGSNKIIEASGGKFSGTFSDKEGRDTKRFEIDNS